jgi:DNA-directed RNA polymerase specialized sigma24 family protein
MGPYKQDMFTSSSNIAFVTSWDELYPKLRTLIRHLVHSFHVQSWSGQEDDIVDDILQETARRILERQQKAEGGEALPIEMFERMAMVTASNYCRDLRRKDRRLVHLPCGACLGNALDITGEEDVIDLSEEATEHIYQERLFELLAGEIVKFPCKQRNALLVDLANRMCFETRPTLLQQAFLKRGIRLQEYQQPVPESTKERSKHAALLYHACKRVAQLQNMLCYISAA